MTTAEVTEWFCPGCEKWNFVPPVDGKNECGECGRSYSYAELAAAEPQPKPPLEDCHWCHGTGTVYDWVPTPFGSGNCQMPSDCDCVWRDE